MSFEDFIEALVVKLRELIDILYELFKQHDDVITSVVVTVIRELVS